MATPDSLKSYPDPVPAAYEARILAIQPAAITIYNQYSVPYFVQAQMAADGYHTLTDLATRWESAKDARSQAAKDYDFEDGSNQYTEKTSLRACIRLSQAVAAAIKRMDPDDKSLENTPDAVVKLQPGLRSQMEVEYAARNGGNKPQLEHQGSDHYLAMQYKACMKGEIGVFTNKQIIGYLPELGETRTRKRRRRDLSNVIIEEDEEERDDPISMDQWKNQIKIFTTCLLMCTYMFPHHKQFDAGLEDIKTLYRKIQGNSLGGAPNKPSLKVLMIAERKAWREIALKMYRGTTLKEAIDSMIQDSLFWTIEVINHTRGMAQPAASGADGRAWQGNWQRSQYQGNKGKGRNFKGYRAAPFKGGKGRGGKAAGRGKNWGGKPWQPPAGQQQAPAPWQNNAGQASPQPIATWAPNWSAKDSKGKPFCRNKILYNNCTGNCGRSHQCPYTYSDGRICNANHHPNDPNVKH